MTHAGPSPPEISKVIVPVVGSMVIVTTSLDAYARPRDVAGNAVHCVSRGALERRLAELITEGT